MKLKINFFMLGVTYKSNGILNLLFQCERDGGAFLIYAPTTSTVAFTFFTSPCNTFPGPISVNEVAPSAII